MLLLSFQDIFTKRTFFIRVSNGSDPDQDRRSVGPDLGSNCLQWFSTYRQTSKVATSEKSVEIDILKNTSGHL